MRQLRQLYLLSPLLVICLHARCIVLNAVGMHNHSSTALDQFRPCSSIYVGCISSSSMLILSYMGSAWVALGTSYVHKYIQAELYYFIFCVDSVEENVTACIIMLAVTQACLETTETVNVSWGLSLGIHFFCRKRVCQSMSGSTACWEQPTL